ncbi:MAG: L,D-transpeptidase family protein [Alistipes sp.]|nr:L,D-transpeptidase family protein [Alistipes sp.]MDE7129010.1 L,D-transpeptidase family protein [Alistipes sp.]
MKRCVLTTILPMLLLATATAQGITTDVIEAYRSVDERCRQAVVVIGSDDSQCDICLAERTPDGKWICGDKWRGTTGSGGLVEAQLKREGDGCTPCGAYALRRGLWRTADVRTRFPMQTYDDRCVWIDDPHRPDYNTLVCNAETETLAHGERLAEIGEPYDYIIVVEYNTSPVVAGAGSAIFMHVWRAEGRPTAGCVAMSRENMRQLVGWLDPKAFPEAVIIGCRSNAKSAGQEIYEQ